MFYTSYTPGSPATGALSIGGGGASNNLIAWQIADQIVTNSGGKWAHVTSGSPTPAALQTYAGTLGSGSTGNTAGLFAAIYDTADPALAGSGVARMVRFRVASGASASTVAVIADGRDPAASGHDWDPMNVTNTVSTAGLVAYLTGSAAGYLHVTMDDDTLVVTTQTTAGAVAGGLYVELLDPPADGHVVRATFAAIAGVVPSDAAAVAAASSGGVLLYHPRGGAYGTAAQRAYASPPVTNLPTAMDVTSREIALPLARYVSGTTWGYFGASTLCRMLRTGTVAYGAALTIGGRQYVCWNADAQGCLMVANAAP